MKNKGLLFVAGTDTGVGKTWVTALLALKLRQLGFDCGVFKPFASGCQKRGDVLISEDACFLKEVLELSDSLEEICPIRLAEPLAPLIAAQRASISTKNWAAIALESLEHLKGKHDWIIVEGVGGLLAPIWETENGFGSNLDLINNWQLPTVIVARRSLGTINHTLLTLRTPLNLPARFAGLVFNDAIPVEDGDVAAQTSPEFIEQTTGIPIWGHIPFGPGSGLADMEAMAARLEIRL